MKTVTSGMYIIRKSDTKQGKTKNADKLVAGKICVYFDDGSKELVSLHNINIVGYYD